MSNIYIQEPPANGKVLIRSTVGDIDIELWSKEAPKACRNFVQLCLEKYYDGTVFHRVVKGFIAQGGDPNGDGTGGESIYGKPFKDEFHSRLRFVRRGLVAMANTGKDDNGSQFFFTLGSSPELQNKHTIFGKVTGDTLYNMLKLEECLVDKNDRPLYPHKIISTKVLSNPFSDIVPRSVSKGDANIEKEKPKEKVKDFKLLSFGEEAEEEEAEADNVAQLFKGKSKSIHDLANDPKLSSVSASLLYDKTDVKVEKEQQLENVRKKLKVEPEKPNEKLVKDPSVSSDQQHEESAREKVRMQIKALTKELRKKSQQEIKEVDIEEDKVGKKTKTGNQLLDEFHDQQVVYTEKKKMIPSDPDERQKMTLQLLEKFQSKLKAVKENAVDEDLVDDDDDDDNTDSWLAHKLQFEEREVVAKDANMPSEDRYDITDPRNPINQRRRQDKKKKHDHHHRHRDGKS